MNFILTYNIYIKLDDNITVYRLSISSNIILKLSTRKDFDMVNILYETWMKLLGEKDVH